MTGNTLPTLIYDAGCGLCRASVRWLLRRGAAARLEIQPYQAHPSAMLLAGLTDRDCADAAFVVEQRPGRPLAAYRGAAAVSRCLRTLPGWRNAGWRLLGRVYALPLLKQLLDLGYGWVARNRARISRACSIQR